MKNLGNRWSRVRAGLCAGVLLSVACGSYAAPVWVVDGIAALNGDAGGEGLVAPPNDTVPCTGARDGCSAPMDFAPDLRAMSEAWTSIPVPHSEAALWPSRTVIAPDSARELIALLLGREAKDIRLANPQFVFSLGAPQADLTSASLGLADWRTATISPVKLNSTLEAKAENAASRGIPREGSNALLREMIEGLTGNLTAHLQALGKIDAPPQAYYEEGARSYGADPVPRADPQNAKETRSPDSNDWSANFLKSFTKMLVSFLQAVRDVFQS